MYNSASWVAFTILVNCHHYLLLKLFTHVNQNISQYAWLFNIFLVHLTFNSISPTWSPLDPWWPPVRLPLALWHGLNYYCSLPLIHWTLAMLGYPYFWRRSVLTPAVTLSGTLFHIQQTSSQPSHFSLSPAPRGSPLGDELIPCFR